jgi:hypothetical protein
MSDEPQNKRPKHDQVPTSVLESLRAKLMNVRDGIEKDYIHAAGSKFAVLQILRRRLQLKYGDGIRTQTSSSSLGPSITATLYPLYPLEQHVSALDASITVSALSCHRDVSHVLYCTVSS